jgi:pimeloyl-ACP methyl ester carboxylesterase
VAPDTGRVSEPAPATSRRHPSRRRFLRSALGGIAVVAAAGTAGFELVDHGVLPGKSALDQLDGACDVPAPDFSPYAKPGPQYSGTFYSKARGTTVGYTIGYPPGHRPGDKLPLVIALHGFGGNHTNALFGLTPAQAVALKPNGTPLPPLALATVDGGGGYWNPHPGDNPQAMLTDELIPLCQRKDLGAGPRGIGVMGISMGGYGAILLAEKYPDLVAAVAAISPAIWTSYAEAQSANAGAYASAADFAADDAVTHAAALAKTPVRVASAYDDPFYSGVQTLARALPKNPGGPPPEVYFGRGCHTAPFFNAQEPPSLAFLARHLTG